jgi:UDP-galactopyranose mutase
MTATPTILCLSTQSWDAARTRPRPLLSRAALEHPVVYLEPPRFDTFAPRLEVTRTPERVVVAVPHLPPELSARAAERAQRHMVDQLLREHAEIAPVLWYYAPQALGFTDHLCPSAVVYDCVEQLESRDDVSTEVLVRERELLARTDVVFTSGYGLVQTKRALLPHANIHPFVACGEMTQFERARELLFEPDGQQEIEHPRVGFYGEIDRSLNLRLLAELAYLRPEVQLILLGPLVGVDPSELPRAPNLHWLGAEPSERVPDYVATWDVAMLPLVHDVTPRFDPATRTAEYLAAGKPVVATSITDVVEPWGRAGLVWLGDDAGELADAIDDALASDHHARVEHADLFLAEHDARATWAAMWAKVEQALAGRALPRAPRMRIGALAASGKSVGVERSA